MGSAARPVETEARGVYEGPNLRHGCRWLYAVKSDGEIHDRILLIRPGKSVPRAFARMRALLDRIDPPRRIALLTDATPRCMSFNTDPDAGLSSMQWHFQLWRRERLKGARRGIPRYR